MRSEYSYTGFKQEMEEVIHDDLDTIIQHLSHDSVIAIILVGSYGRGEGALRLVSGSPQPINDYDLVLVTTNKQEINLNLGDLNDRTAIPTIDVQTLSRDQLSALPASMFHYDLRYGGTVIYGDEHVLSTIPDYDAFDITARDGFILVTNRMSGLLGGLVKNRSDAYINTQRIKLRLAWIDSILIKHGRYVCEYESKIQEVEKLLEEDCLLEMDEANRIIELGKEAYKQKFETLEPTISLTSDIQEEIKHTNTLLTTLIEMSVGEVDTTDGYSSLLHRQFPNIRSTYNAIKLYANTQMPLTSVPSASTYCTEEFIRVLVAAELNNQVFEEREYKQVREIITGLYKHQEGEDESLGEYVFDMWDETLH